MAMIQAIVGSPPVASNRCGKRCKMNRRNWVAVLVFVAVVLVVVLIGCGLLWVLSGAFGGIMSPGVSGRGSAMGGWCPWCGGTGVLSGRPLAGLLILVVIAFVLVGLLALLVAAVVWLVRRGSATKGP
jgi:hypothetical protein